MSAEAISSQNSLLLRVDNDLILNPHIIFLMIPRAKQKPFIDRERGPLFGELRLETAGRNKHVIYLPDYNGARSLVDALNNKINGPQHKPGGRSKLIEIPRSGGVLIFPPVVSGMSIYDKPISSDTELPGLVTCLQIETWGQTTFEVEYENAGHAHKVCDTIWKLAAGKPKVTKRKMELNGAVSTSGRRHDAILAKLHTPANHALQDALQPLQAAR